LNETKRLRESDGGAEWKVCHGADFRQFSAWLKMKGEDGNLIVGGGIFLGTGKRRSREVPEYGGDVDSN
jgi:hypothetical protein